MSVSILSQAPGVHRGAIHGQGGPQRREPSRTVPQFKEGRCRWDCSLARCAGYLVAFAHDTQPAGHHYLLQYAS